jgi:hypothetical protein
MKVSSYFGGVAVSRAMFAHIRAVSGGIARPVRLGVSINAAITIARTNTHVMLDFSPICWMLYWLALA